MRSIRFAALSSVPLFMIGCGGDTTEVINDYNQRRTLEVVGSLVDVSTLRGIDNATVTLLIDGNTTLTATSSGDAATAGRFTFSDVPEGSHRLTISAEGYAVIEAPLHLGSLVYDSEGISGGLKQINFGQIGLSRPVSLMAKVSADGQLMSDVVVQAKILGLNKNCGTQLSTRLIGSDFASRTDANGEAVFDSLSQCGVYQFTVPAIDQDGDGSYDYQTLLTGSAYNNARTRTPSSYGETDGIDPRGYPSGLSLALKSFVPQAQLSLTYSSFEDSSTISFYVEEDFSFVERFDNVHFLASDKVLKFAFNTPATPISDLQTVKRNFFVDPLDIAYAKDIEVDAAVTWEASNTVVSIAPPAGGYQENNIYVVRGTLQATGVQGNGSTLVLGSSNTIFYIPKAGAPTLRAKSVNMHGSSRLAILASEYVKGSLHVRAQDGVMSDREIHRFDLIRAVNIGCNDCGEAVFFGDTWTDSSPGDSIVVEADLVDAEGNHLAGVFDLTVE